MHRISANHYGLIGDYSNGLVACRNVDAISFSIFEDPMLRIALILCITMMQ